MLYGYDVDEQSSFINQLLWSKEEYVNISWDDFFKKYGNDSIYRGIIIKKNAGRSCR